MLAKQNPSQTAEELQLRAIKRLAQLSRAPGQCPIANCSECVFPSGLMSHLRSCHAHTHTKNPKLVFHNVYESKPLQMELPDLRVFDECDVPHCIGVLQFGGEYNKPKSAPGHRFLCVPNTDLRQDDQKYENYLPMAMMVSKSTWHAMSPSGSTRRRHATEGSWDDASGIFVIWLSSPVTVKPFYYTMTVFNGSYQHSISVIRKSRNFVDSQIPSKFLANDTHYMILRDADIQLLLDMPKEQGDKQQGIQMEIIVHELLNGSLTQQLEDAESNVAIAPETATESQTAAATSTETKDEAAKKTSTGPKTEMKDKPLPQSEWETDSELKVDALLKRLGCTVNSSSSDVLSDSESKAATGPKTEMAAEPMPKPESEADSEREVDALLERLGYQATSGSSVTSPMPSGLSTTSSSSSI